jgi:uncharacterized protein YgiM (DUF1202 family)
MKIYIILLISTMLFAIEDGKILTKAVTKLIKENQMMHSEIRLLKLESEKFKKLEYDVEKMKKRIKLLEREENNDLLISPFKPLIFKVKATALNVRSGPKLNYKIIGSLNKDEKVKVIKRSNNGWYQINYEDNVGWVSAKWLIKEEE